MISPVGIYTELASRKPKLLHATRDLFHSLIRQRSPIKLKEVFRSPYLIVKFLQNSQEDEELIRHHAFLIIL
jgi:hypothetical protein